MALSVGNNDQNTLYLGERQRQRQLRGEDRAVNVRILSGSDSYSGGTLVSAGVLCVTNAYALPDETNLTVGPGGTFVYDPSVTGAPGETASGEATTGAAVAVPEPGTLLLLAVALWSAAWAPCLHGHRRFLHARRPPVDEHHSGPRS